MKGEVVSGYTIIEKVKIGEVTYVLGEHLETANPYVVWSKDFDGGGYHWGHYFTEKTDAVECLYAFAHREAKIQNETFKENKAQQQLSIRKEYIDNKLADVIGYYRIEDKDIERFLDMPSLKKLKTLLLTNDLSMDDIKKVLAFDRNIYPVPNEVAKSKHTPEKER